MGAPAGGVHYNDGRYDGRYPGEGYADENCNLGRGELEAALGEMGGYGEARGAQADGATCCARAVSRGWWAPADGHGL